MQEKHQILQILQICLQNLKENWQICQKITKFCKHGWMDGWMNGWMEGRTNRQTEIDRQTETDRHIHRHRHRHTHTRQKDTHTNIHKHSWEWGQYCLGIGQCGCSFHVRVQGQCEIDKCLFGRQDNTWLTTIWLCIGVGSFHVNPRFHPTDMSEIWK